MTNIMQRFEARVLNAAKRGQRWFGIKGIDALAEFACDDPYVLEVVNNKDFEKTFIHQVICHLCEDASSYRNCGLDRIATVAALLDELAFPPECKDEGRELIERLVQTVFDGDWP